MPVRKLADRPTPKDKPEFERLRMRQVSSTTDFDEIPGRREKGHASRGLNWFSWNLKPENPTASICKVKPENKRFRRDAKKKCSQTKIFAIEVCKIGSRNVFRMLCTSRLQMISYFPGLNLTWPVKIEFSWNIFNSSSLP